MYRILVVDTDRLIRWSIRETFSQQECLVDEAESADAALYLIEKSPYSLIFVDYDVAGSIDPSLLDKIRELQTGSKIVLLTTLSEEQTRARIQNISPFAVIEKPFQTEEIKSTAKTALDSV